MIGSVYEYYLTTYGSKPVTKSDTHKKSELRSIYNDIVKLSKKTPLYKIDVSDDMAKYVIDLKENARNLKSATDSNVSEHLSNIHNKFISTDEQILTVNYIGKDSDSSGDNESFTFHVDKLASPQINTGNFLKSDTTSLSKGDHKFEISIDGNTYEFQFKVKNDDNDLKIQEKLSRLINNSKIGLRSTVLSKGNKSALQIESVATGAVFKGNIFSVNDSANESFDISNYYGLNNVSMLPSNAEFKLNDMEKSSATNTFTINKKFEITLHSPNSGEETTSLKQKDDVDTFIDSVHNVIFTYNSIISLGSKQTEKLGDCKYLKDDIRNTFLPYKSTLETIGISCNQDGTLSFDDSLAIQSASENHLANSVDVLEKFNTALSKRADDISINPMKYVNKIMISYPNPIRSFVNPYMTSIYSGMMFSGYI